MNSVYEPLSLWYFCDGSPHKLKQVPLTDVEGGWDRSQRDFPESNNAL